MIELNLGDLDVILRMNWLGLYKAKVDCEAHKVVLRSPLGKLTSYRRFGKPKNFGVISSMQVKKLVKKGCELFFCSVRDVTKDVELKIEDIPILSEFMDVFSSKIYGTPPRRAIEFTINLVPGTAPIYKARYRIAPHEMRELKTRLQKLL